MAPEPLWEILEKELEGRTILRVVLDCFKDHAAALEAKERLPLPSSSPNSGFREVAMSLESLGRTISIIGLGVLLGLGTIGGLLKEDVEDLMDVSAEEEL